MVALNFSPQFAPLVEAQTKCQTIRRTSRAKIGDRLQLYTGQRTASCRKLVSPDPICVSEMYIGLTARGITLGNVGLFPRDIDEFARADGFTSYDEMWRWFSDRYETNSFTGRVIRWAHDKT